MNQECGKGAADPPRHFAARTRHAAVIELFGPAAAGKTTLARALEAAFRARGVGVRIISSARPAEQVSPRTGRLARLATQMTAPTTRASKLLGALGAAMQRTPLDPCIDKLMALLPSGGRIRSLRLRRYLVELCRSWGSARDSGDVVIVEQGFVNVISSLGLFAGSIDRRAMARALALVPEPDLLVRMIAPRELLAARLQERLRRQTALERLFENDIEDCLRQVEIAAALDALLTESGRPPMRLSSLDPAGLGIAVDAITREIERRTGMDFGATAPASRGSRDDDGAPLPG